MLECHTERLADGLGDVKLLGITGCEQEMVHVATIITDMDIALQPGMYVVAVSGGIDSMTLLDLLCRHADLRLVVAHFDHGMRLDSSEDRRLVQQAAAQYGLPFVYAQGALGPSASEAAARRARYAFLERVRQAAGARAILTAHHADDVLETAILNMLRGTGRRGLTSLAPANGHVWRPLLSYTKAQLTAYATARDLRWREDATNADERYSRNYIRHRLLPQFTPAARQQLRAIIEQSRRVNAELDAELANLMHLQPGRQELQRDYFTYMPHKVAVEFLAAWLRARGVRSFDRKTLERVAVAAKTQRTGTKIDIIEGTFLQVSRQSLALITNER